MNASIAFSTISNTGNIRSNKRGGLFQLGIVKPVRKVYESNQRRCIKDYFCHSTILFDYCLLYHLISAV